MIQLFMEPEIVAQIKSGWINDLKDGSVTLDGCAYDNMVTAIARRNQNSRTNSLIVVDVKVSHD